MNRSNKKKALITGPTSGTGKFICNYLIAQGYEMILVGRKLNRVETGTANVYLYEVDLADVENLRNTVEKIKADHSAIDFLICNAGILGNEMATVLDHGNEKTFTVNYLSHYFIISTLLSSVLKSNRKAIINMCSESYKWNTLDFDDFQTTNNYKPMLAYGRSKRKLLNLGLWVSQNVENVNVYNIDPGTFRSGIARSRGPAFRLIYNLAKWFMRSPEQACADIVKIISSEDYIYSNGALIRKGREIIYKPEENELESLLNKTSEISGIDIRSEA